jgi:hypothetical protein
MTQPTHEQRLREGVKEEFEKTLRELLDESSLGSYINSFHCAKLIDRLANESIAKHREFVKEVKEQFKDLIAHSSYKIDAGGRVERESSEVERVCHEIIKDIDLMPLLQLEETNEK